MGGGRELLKKSQDVTRFGVMVAVVIVLAVLASFALLFFGNQNPEVVLPPVSTAPLETEQPVFSDDGFQLVQVTPDTVQNVIATLARPSSYHRTVTVEQFWPDEDGENGMSSAKAESKVWVDGVWTRIDLSLSSGPVRCTIVKAADGEAEGAIWSWEEGQRTWYAGTSDAWDADLAQWCPTYEDVLALPADSITHAGYELISDTPCILVEVSDQELGYTRSFWISVESGLLMAAEVWGDGVLLYRMTGTQNAVLGADPVFVLPDDTVLHEAGVIDQEIAPGQE